MKLNLNSKTSKLYRWFYATQTMPQSLCPYFWKLVLMWILIIPYTFLSLPIILMDLKNPERRTTGERAGMGFMIWFILGMLVCMLSLLLVFFIEPVKDSLFFNMAIAGVGGWFFAIGIGFAELLKWAKRKWENRNVKYDENGYRIWAPIEPKQDSILVSFVKASYNKYCPKIEWTKNDNK